MAKTDGRKCREYLNTICRELHHPEYGRFTLADKAKQQYLEEFNFGETALDNPLGNEWKYLKSEFQESCLHNTRKGRGGKIFFDYRSNSLLFKVCQEKLPLKLFKREITSIRISQKLNIRTEDSTD